MQNAIRDHAVAQKRAVGREERQADAMYGAGAEVEGGQTTPSELAARRERVELLAKALAKLPEDGYAKVARAT